MTLEISINGQIFSGFERGSVVLGMDSAANMFDLEYVADPSALSARHIYPGDACSISLDPGNGEREEALDGYVVTTDEEDGEDAVRLSAAGYSRTGDLAMVSVLSGMGPWSNAKLSKIVSDICEPFSINVFVEGDEGEVFARFSTQKSETALDAIARAALRRGMFPYCTGGDLIIARAGATRTSTVLARGDGRLIRSGRSDSWSERYSDYLFRGQARSTDENFGAKSSQLKSSVKDEAVTRFLPLLVQAEANEGIDLRTRAELERNQRAGRSENITALVNGWATDEGKLWRPNMLVRFTNQVLGVDATLLVTRAAFRVGAEEPRETELTLARPEAYDLAKYPALGRGESWT